MKQGEHDAAGGRDRLIAGVSATTRRKAEAHCASTLPCFPSIRTVDETSTAEATSDSSDALTAPDVCPRTRQSSDSLSATSLRPLPSVTSRTLRSTPSTPCPSSTSRSPTVSRVPSTPTLCECDRALDEGTVLPPFEFVTTRTERRVSIRWTRMFEYPTGGSWPGSYWRQGRAHRRIRCYEAPSLLKWRTSSVINLTPIHVRLPTPTRDDEANVNHHLSNETSNSHVEDGEGGYDGDGRTRKARPHILCAHDAYTSTFFAPCLHQSTQLSLPSRTPVSDLRPEVLPLPLSESKSVASFLFVG